MTTMHHEAQAKAQPIMYIRGIPFRCPVPAGKAGAVSVVDKNVDTAAPSKASAAPTQAAQTVKTAKATPLFAPSNLLARFGTACGSRAGISRAETEAQTRFVKSRRAVRVFADKMVPMRLLRELITTVARDQGEAHSGLARFIVVEAAPAMDQVTRLAANWLRQEGVLADGAGPDADARKVVFGGAPHLAVAYGKSDSPADAEACAEAFARLEWAGAAMGLGTCFAGEMLRAAAASSALSAALSIPTGHTAYAALFIGYPGFAADQPEKAPGVRIIWL